MPNPKATPFGRPEPETRDGWVRKCDLDDYLGRALPIPNQVVSNEEFLPLPQTPAQRAVEARLLASADRAPGENEQDAMRLGTVFTRMRALPKPVVAAVHGRALAGGAGLATACDIVLATESAQFGYPEIQRGFVPAMVMTLLRRVTTEKKAFDLVATGRILPARSPSQLVAPGIHPGGRSSEDTGMPTGTIARLLIDKGFGFIRDETGVEHFFHRSAVRGAVFELLREGQRVDFQIEESAKGPRAGDVRLIEN